MGSEVRPDFANQIRRRLPSPGDKQHLDEVIISIAGRKHWLWRAADQHGVVLDIPGPEPSQRHSSRRSRVIGSPAPNNTPAPRLLRSLVVHANRIEHIEHPAWCQAAARMN
jgi:putative transposase